MIVIVIGFISSCKKDNNNGNGTNTGAFSMRKIQSLTEYYNGTLQSVDSFQYDNKWRVIKDIMDDGSYTTYEYSNLKVTVKSFYNDNTLMDIATGFLNANGYATLVTDSSYGKKKKSGIHIKKSDLMKGVNSSGLSLTYDNNGYLISTSQIADSATATYTILNGNTTSIIYLMNNNVAKAQFTELFTFNDKSNTIGLENQGISFMGKQNKNLASSYTSTEKDLTNNTTYSTTTQYTYEYDNKGRVTKQTETDSSSSDTYTYVYTYTD